MREASVCLLSKVSPPAQSGHLMGTHLQKAWMAHLHFLVSEKGMGMQVATMGNFHHQKVREQSTGVKE